ncbi:hypothetical protein BPSP16_08530 [Brachyspira pilosicoli SP16]|nr:hypothetical protein BPSP16_08530 [Brachyspira pilosicoli SP16]
MYILYKINTKIQLIIIIIKEKRRLFAYVQS